MAGDHLHELILCLDAKGAVTLIDGGLCVRLGLDPATALGQSHSVALDHRFAPLSEALGEALRGKAASQRMTLDGLPVKATCYPQRSVKGKVSGAVAIVTADAASDGSDKGTGVEAQSLPQSEDRYRQLFDSIADICFVIDRDWRYTAVNQAASRVTRRSPRDLIGKSALEIIAQPELDALITPYRLAMETGESRQFTVDCPLLPDCLPGKFDIAVYPIAEGIMCVAHDITERVRAEESLRQSEQRYHTLFEESREAIFIASMNGRIIDINQAALDLFGMTRPEAHNVSIAELCAAPADHEEFAGVISSQGAARDYPIRFKRKDGKELDCLITASAWRAASLEIQGYQGHVRDISAQKQADQALRESEARFRAVFEGATLGIAVFDLTGSPLMVNPALQAIVEYSSDELRGMSLRDLIFPEDLAENWQQFIALAQGQRDHYQMESRCITRSGEAVWVNVGMSVVWDIDDKPLYVIAVIEDIRDRRQAEEALRESEDRYRRLVELSPEPLAVHVAGKLVYLNAACARMLGAQTADEIIGRDVMDFVHIDFRDVVTQRIRQVQERNEDVPLIQEKFVRLDGKIIDVEVVSIPIVYHGQAGSQVVMRDITDRLRAEASERALAEALRNTSAAVNSTLELSEVLKLILSSVGQVVPHEAATIMLIDDEGAARVVEEHGYAERGFGDEVRAQRFSVEYVENLKRMHDTRQTVYIPDLDEYKGWLKMRHTDWIRSYIGAPISLGDEVIGFINLESSQARFFSPAHVERLQTFADQVAIAIKNARLYDDLRRHAAELQERNSDLDAFSHTVAHDLKAPLHVIIGYTSLILSDYQDHLEPEILAHLGNVAQYADKLDTLIESMMLLAKLRSADVQIVPVSPSPLVADAIDRFRRQIDERHVRVEVAGELPTVMTYAPWLEEIFANLIENAIKYLGSKNPAPQIIIRGSTLTDGMARFQVEDNGIGISEENRQGLFKTGYRVHPAGDVKGAGLGLSIVERIVQRLDGKLGVESAPGKGSIFWFSLATPPRDVPPQLME